MANFVPKSSSSRQGTSQNITIGASSTALATAFGSQTFQVLLVTTTACNFRIGDGTPTAVATDTYLPPNFPLYFTVTPGQKVAVIGTTGTLSVTEIS
jgi:hypothetical protein